MDLSRVDRVLHTIDPAKLAATGLTITGVTVALLPVRGTPTAATVWTPLTSYTAPTTAKIRLAGPDADPTAALVVPADCDLWALVTDGTQTEAVKVERLTVEGSSGSITALPVPFVTSVQGRTGAVTLTTADVGADTAGAATTAQTAAQAYADTKVAAEVTRANAAYDAAGVAATAQAASLQKSANLSDVAVPATARTNLGLGTAATHAVTDFDASGAATTAQAAAIAAAATDATTKANAAQAAAQSYAAGAAAGMALVFGV